MSPHGGRTEAQLRLGAMYMAGAGRGVPKDYGEAAKWLRKAADENNADAQVGLGHIYVNGPRQDYAEAMKWFHKGADQGNAEGQAFLGKMLSFPKIISAHSDDAIHPIRV